MEHVVILKFGTIIDIAYDLHITFIFVFNP